MTRCVHKHVQLYSYVIPHILLVLGEMQIPQRAAWQGGEIFIPACVKLVVEN